MDKTYWELINDFLREQESATLQEIYAHVYDNKKEPPKSWKSRVRNALHYHRKNKKHMFVKTPDNKWARNPEL